MVERKAAPLAFWEQEEQEVSFWEQVHFFLDSQYVFESLLREEQKV